MVAGIFHEHGVWEGRCKPGTWINKKGFHENEDLREILKRESGSLVHKRKEASYSRKVLDEFSKYRPESPWMVKHSAMYWRIWEGLDPNYLCVRRSMEGCIKSNARTRTLSGTTEEIKGIYVAHNNVMDKVRDIYGAVDIFSDEIIEGNYDSLDRAFAYCGLKMDKAIVDKFVSKDLWHF